MHKPTTEQLQTELQEVVTKHNQAQEVMTECKTRFTEIQAILKDRASCEEVTEEG
jgi:chaperonin cofactor prefoldin|tara:strand:- start:5035 stop:5199 length:165 start_codon:yes stop_codon:yes gene_type:complete